MADAVLVERDGGVARLTINRPDKLNSLNEAVIQSLLAFAESVEDDPDLKAVTLRGAGGNFSAGADLSMFGAAVDAGDRERVTEYVALIHDALDAVEAIPVPTLGVVEGFALAGGLELALVCDLLVASTEASIGDQHANYGLVAGGGATQRLPRQIARRHANELLYTGRRISGSTAAEWGLVNRAVPPDALDAEVSDVEASLERKSHTGSALIKELVRKGLRTDMETGLELERRAVVDHDFSADAREGFAAFREDREPEF